MQIEQKCTNFKCENTVNYILKEKRAKDAYWICEQCFTKLEPKKQKDYVDVNQFQQYCQNACKQTNIEMYINQFKGELEKIQQQLKQLQSISDQLNSRIKEFQDMQINTQSLIDKLKNSTIAVKDFNEFFEFFKKYQKNNDDESNCQNLLKSLDLYKQQFKALEKEKIIDFLDIESKINLVDDGLGFQKYIQSVIQYINLKEKVPFCFKTLAYDSVDLTQNQTNYIGCKKDNKKHGFGIEIQKNRVQLGAFLEDSFVWGSMFIMKQMNHYAYFVGHFKDNLLHGKGYWNQTKTIDGKLEISTYQGDMKFGMRDGLGKYIWPNGTIYEGPWVNNLKHGQGHIQYPNQESSETIEFVNDRNKKKIQQIQPPSIQQQFQQNQQFKAIPQQQTNHLPQQQQQPNIHPHPHPNPIPYQPKQMITMIPKK